MEKQTKLISAFPGTGKTYFFNHTADKHVLDSDSSKFDKSKFPENYLIYIKNNISKVDIILISSHKEVRDALEEAGLEFTLVYPQEQLKQEYVDRFKQRGDNKAFISLISVNWTKWLKELHNQCCNERIELGSNEYLSDIKFD